MQKIVDRQNGAVLKVARELANLFRRTQRRHRGLPTRSAYPVTEFRDGALGRMLRDEFAKETGQPIWSSLVLIVTTD